jgi:hypothetical protein
MTSRVLASLGLLLPAALSFGACGGTVEGGPGGGNDASTQDGTTVGPDSSTTLDGTSSSDTSIDRVSVTEGSTGLPCGMTTCNSVTQECCATRGGGTCIERGGGCDGGLPITCSGPEDCSVSGDVCCAEGLGGGGASVSCTTMADCRGVLLCKNNSDCPDMEPCDPGPDGYEYCRFFMEPDGGFHHHHHDGGGLHPPDGGFVPPDGDVPP